MDAPHHPLDRMTLHRCDRAVRVLEAELEEERDVEPGDRDDDEQEDEQVAGAVRE